MSIQPYNYTNISTATTTLIKSGVGQLNTIVINNTAAATITIYDSLTASGTKIGTIAASPAIGMTFDYEIAFTIGLTIVTAGSSDITVSWS
jgi:hypothetical protein